MLLDETVPTVPSPTHAHDRTCFWDLNQGRWAGPRHPELRVQPQPEEEVILRAA